jgi:hypothetical protein
MITYLGLFERLTAGFIWTPYLYSPLDDTAVPTLRWCWSKCCSSTSLTQFMLWTLWDALVSTIEMHEISSKILPFVASAGCGPLLHLKGGLKDWFLPPSPKIYSVSWVMGAGIKDVPKLPIYMTCHYWWLVATLLSWPCCCSLQRWPIKKSTNFHIVQNFLHFLEIIFYTWSDKGNDLSSTTATSLHSWSLTKKAKHVD